MRCALLAATATVLACGGPRLQERSVADLAQHLPATLEVERPREGEPRTVEVRIWADAAVRAQPRWRDELGEQLDYASQVLTPLAGVRLVVESYRDWDRTGEPREALRQLAEADPGDGVTWVIGYIAAPDTLTKVLTELGQAEPLGRHVVIRSWADRAEARGLAGSLPELTDAERTEVLAAHRRHKQTVVLLRALAATLGGIAATDPAWIQHPSYSPKQTKFSDRNRELITLALEARAAEQPEEALAKRLLDAIEKAPWGGWIEADHDQVVNRMRNVLDAAKEGKTAAEVPAAAYDQYARIKTLAKQGKTADALAELDNLVAAYPGNAAMTQLRCDIMLAARPKVPEGKPFGVADPATRAACTRASELAPGDPSPHLAVGEALAGIGDMKGTRAELVQAEAKIGNLPAGKEEAWRKLIALYQQIGALTWTEQAIAKAQLEHDPIAAQVAQVRARYGVPRGTRLVSPEQEALLVAAVRGALDLIYASKYGEAEAALARAEKRWPGAPGLAGARCDLALRLGQIPAARTACNKALARDPNASWALYLSGVLALRDASGTATGIARLEKAIEVDPELAQAWRTLAKAYARVKDQPKLDRLDKAYQAKFGTPLPR